MSVKHRLFEEAEAERERTKDELYACAKELIEQECLGDDEFHDRLNLLDDFFENEYCEGYGTIEVSDANN